MVFAFNEDKSKATVIPVESGGTGATTASAAISNLGAAAASHNHSAGNITSGTLPISRGGTGATTASAALSNLHGVECTTEAKNYYVSTSGSNSNSGLTASKPFRTIQHAVDILPKYLLHNVTIYVADGNYNEDVVISGFSGANLAIGEPSANPSVLSNKKTKSITICDNSASINIYEMDFTTSAKAAIRIYSNGNFIYLYRISAVTSSTYDGVYASETPQIAIFNSCFSNKANAIHMSNTCLSVSNNSGSGNAVGYFLEKSSEMRLVDVASTLTATTAVWQTGGSTKYDVAGNIY